MDATSDLEDALAAAKEFLLPFEWGRWWRLALVALFLSSGTALNPPSIQTGLPSGVGGGAPVEPGSPDGPAIPGGAGDVIDALPADLIALAIALVIVATALGVVLAAVGAIMEFVLIESLRQETVSIRRYVSRRWRQGLRLFGFNVVLGVVAALVVGTLIAVALAPVVLLDSLALTAVALVAVVPAVLVAGVLAAAAFGFTSAFVVPAMVLEDCGVLAGWRRFLPVLRREYKEYVAFALVYVALLIIVGIVTGVAVGIGAILLVIPFGVVALIAVSLLGTASTAGIALLVVVGVLWLLSVIALFAFVQVPVVTFLRYYSLFLLGDTEESLDLIPERRAAVR
ncbi:hypothetical protein BRC81_07655 [Halobacteriales archaeon QS_1_68_20]|nr:MAG: hypothetical protein BRC81_07655 [Halobacteriales archaeon QS_1_68_20]